MGKNRHSKDRMFITATEWRESYGGKKMEGEKTHRALPFDSCALSLTPFETPVCTREGVVFDILNIVPYVKKHKKNPVNGAPLGAKDLVRLNIAKNAEGKWHCPVTFKVFNDNSRVVAIAKTGNVYAADAVDELNIKAKNWTDLLTGEDITPSDVIKINDPADPALLALRDVNNFVHLKEVREEVAKGLGAMSHQSKIRQTTTTAEIFKDISLKRRRDEEEREKQEAEEEANRKAREAESIAKGEPLWKRQKIFTDDLVDGRVMTTGKTSGSFTSSAMQVSTSNDAREATLEEVNEARWSRLRKLGKKAFVQLQTSHGNINVEIHCDIVPRTAENFIGLCLKGYYDGTVFHRLIRNFMIQGGDPTGTGTGGESYWGGKFKDEFDSRMVHDKRGLLSMANSGPNTNGSQFFITLKSCRHLDNLHSVFGRVVGGLNTLSKLEIIPTDSKDRPKNVNVVLTKAVVFQNPIEEMEAAFEEELKAKSEAREKKKLPVDPRAHMPTGEEDRIGWASNPTPIMAGTKSGVGKYIGVSAPTTLPRSQEAAKAKTSETQPLVDTNAAPSKKPKVAKAGFSDFSGW